MSTPLAITGLGIIAAPGRGLDINRAALGSASRHLACYADPRLPLAAELPVGRVTSVLPTPTPRTAALAHCAISDALTDAALTDRSACALLLGTCTGGMPESEAAYLAQPEQVHAAFAQQEAHRVTARLAQQLGCHGPRSTHSVACASAACALAEAAEWIRQGLCPSAVVVGADALCRLTMAGFHSLKVVDPAGCRPLTEERSGMTLGEGAAALVIEHPEHARARGARIRASLLGWGLRSDAYHATAPDPDGSQLQQAIAAALTDAELSAQDVAYACAHGTGTRDNDHCETAALAASFGTLPCASSKGSYGHCMGAAAAVEAVGSCLAIEAGTAWASAGASEGTPLTCVDVVTTPRPLAGDVICSTSLAFGGVNAALLFGGAERCA
ncbi:MAG: beta-ketoacyl synthase N-terminal-like domain-containing protein [Planctomycetota bacterium]|jgi:3-oxoacyl-[acyl-carrier-protein] synthase II|nr:beta-ketoacyl synthase N-terminal-like domain-containing protein [Planctomycetota bacterium]